MHQVDAPGACVSPLQFLWVIDKKKTTVLGLFEGMNMLENDPLWWKYCAHPVYIHRHPFGKMTWFLY